MLPLPRLILTIQGFLLAFLLPGKTVFAQPERTLRGIVRNPEGNAVENAVLIFQPGGQPGWSDANGKFRLAWPPKAEMLLIGASGYLRDTLFPKEDSLSIILIPISGTGKEVTVTENKNPGQIDFRNASLNLQIDRTEMRKAACCNLSESFETSPLVDVSFPDPVSGIRQIQLMGLSGKYTGYSVENQLVKQGTAGSYYASLIPGPWLQSIQVQKGIAPAAAGPGLLAGQINSNYLKADTSDKLILNQFASQMGRLESNLVLPIRKSTAGGTALFLHGNASLMNMDVNQDGYRELPLGRQINGMLRSHHAMGSGGVLQLSLQTYLDERTGGDLKFNDRNPAGFNGFGFFSRVSGMELNGKAGKVFSGTEYLSAGIPWSAGWRQNEQLPGRNQLQLEEKWLRIDPVFQADIGKKGNGIKAGLNYSARQRQEKLRQAGGGPMRQFNIEEQSAGIFAEGSFILFPGFLLIAGNRIEHHNYYGWRYSPRLHIRFENTNGAVFRLAAGRSWHDPEIFAENLTYFYSGRVVEIIGKQNNLPYGLAPESGESMNFSLTQNYRILPGKGSILLEGFANRISRQVIADAETPGKLQFYNAENYGRSGGFAVQLDQKAGRKTSVRLAYRYAESWSAFAKGKLSQPLWSFHRAFAFIDFLPGRGYAINGGIQFHGQKRLYGGNEKSPAFPLINIQLSKEWKKHYEVSAGMENLLGYRQKVLINAPDQALSTEFDAARVWGPAFGRMLYLNFRLVL